MTIEEARALIPPGYVECEYYAWRVSLVGWQAQPDEDHLVYAIPAPKPEPRRVEVGGDVEFDSSEFLITSEYSACDVIQETIGTVANTRWKCVQPAVYVEVTP